jgi:hypothetical protein
MMKSKMLALALAGVTGFGTMGATLAPAQAVSGFPAGSRSTQTSIIQVQGVSQWNAGEGRTRLNPNEPRGQADPPRAEPRRDDGNRDARRNSDARHDNRAERRNDGDRYARGRHDDNRRYDNRRYYDDRRNYNRNPHWRGDRRYYQGRYWRPADDGWYVYNDGAWIAAGALGLAAGALLGSTLSQQQAPATIQSGAPVTANGIPPWTPAWYQYCSGKYKSFNAQTGLYLGYDGKYHYCR